MVNLRAQAISCVLGVALLGWLGGGQGTTVTSLDGKTVIGDLDESQFARLCRDIDQWNQTEFGSAMFRAALCEIEAAATLRQQHDSPVGAQGVCRDMARQCEQTRAGIANIAPQCQRGGRCSRTVADVERCLFDLAYNMNVVLCTAPVCDDICGIVDERAVDAPSCAALRASCPAFRFTRPSFEWLVELNQCTSAGPVTTSCVWH